MVVYSAENNTTSEHGVVGWQIDASNRGTLDIILSSIFTILACTWSVQHLNVPGPNDNKARWRRISWTFITIFFPELLLAHAVIEFLMALESMEDMEKCAGVRVRYPDLYFPLRWLHLMKKREIAQPSDDDEEYLEIEWTLTHAYYANMGGFHLFMKKVEFDPDVRDSIEVHFRIPPKNMDNKYVELCSLTAKQLEFCLNNRAFFQFPEVPLSEKEIKDKGKLELFTKLIAVVQILVLLVSTILRACRHLAISQLEIVTLVFALCAIMIYVFRWFKPQSVETSTRIWLKSDPFDSGKEDKLNTDLKTNVNGLRKGVPDSIFSILTNFEECLAPKLLSRIPNDNIPQRERHRMHAILYLLTVLTVAAGGLHLIAWDFEFPTRVERKLWKAACFMLIGLPLFSLFIVPISRYWMWHIGTHKFMRACWKALLLESWESQDREKLQLPTQQLSQILSGNVQEKRHYKDIFQGTSRDDIEGFAKRQRLHLPKEFVSLKDIISEEPKKLYREEADRTDYFPPKIFTWSNSVFFMTFFLYVFARLLMFALAFSSLRLLPESAYKTTWADVIPHVT